jgi:hypothetical protein
MQDEGCNHRRFAICHWKFFRHSDFVIRHLAHIRFHQMAVGFGTSTVTRRPGLALV